MRNEGKQRKSFGGAAVHHTSKLSGLFCVYVIYGIGLVRFEVAYALCFVVSNKSPANVILSETPASQAHIKCVLLRTYMKSFPPLSFIVCAQSQNIFVCINARKCKASFFQCHHLFCFCFAHTNVFGASRDARIIHVYYTK